MSPFITTRSSSDHLPLRILSTAATQCCPKPFQTKIPTGSALEAPEKQVREQACVTQVIFAIEETQTIGSIQLVDPFMWLLHAQVVAREFVGDYVAQNKCVFKAYLNHLWVLHAVMFTQLSSKCCCTRNEVSHVLGGYI